MRHIVPAAKPRIIKADHTCAHSRSTLRLALLLLLLTGLNVLGPATALKAERATPTPYQQSQQDAEEQPPEEQAPTLPEGAVAPRRNARLVVPLRDKPDELVKGKVLWFDLDKVAYADQEDKQHKQVNWESLDPERLPRVLNTLPDIRDPEGLLVAAELLIRYNGEEHAITRLFAYAVRNDPDAQAKVDALLDRMNNKGNAEPPGQDNPGNTTGEAGPRGEGKGPAVIGPQTPRSDDAWPVLTKQQNDQVIERLVNSTDQVLEKMGHKMGSTQTERFIVYSDMPAKESRYWVSVLDKMYDRLCEVFDLDKDKNIWHGKCLLMFFNSRSDFLRYNQAAYGNNPAGAAGICYQFGNGDVHISMWHQQDEKELAHTLVHEAVHGFLFRYQSSHYIPNWLNEGLAEFISVSLVDAPRYPRRALDARAFVKQRGRLDNFLSARNIIGPHYGLAYDVTDLMVSENRKGYVAMIRGIKEGLTVEEAFEQKYGASIERVLRYYASTRLRMDNVQLD